MNTSPPPDPNSIDGIRAPPPLIGGGVIGTPAAGVGTGGIMELTGMGMPAAAPPRASGMVGRRMEEVEQELILETLSHCLGNRTRAAEMLGISIRTLRNKLHEYRAAGVSVPPIPGQMPATAVAD